MKKEQLFTIGEIHRQGLLKNFEGEELKHKASVANVVNRLDYKVVMTKWGEGKALTQEQIDTYNNRRK